LIHKDLYYYKNINDSTHRGMHNLSGTYIKKEEKKIVENEEYFGISVIYPKKTRSYYLKDKEEYLDWIKYFYLITEYSTICDLYEISPVILLLFLINKLFRMKSDKENLVLSKKESIRKLEKRLQLK
jgi:hypothetical protein